MRFFLLICTIYFIGCTPPVSVDTNEIEEGHVIEGVIEIIEYKPDRYDDKVQIEFNDGRVVTLSFRYQNIVLVKGRHNKIYYDNWSKIYKVEIE